VPGTSILREFVGGSRFNYWNIKKKMYLCNAKYFNEFQYEKKPIYNENLELFGHYLLSDSV
jgi:hypothetical protein